MLAGEPRVAERRTQPREPREQRAVEGGHLVALDRPAERLGPQFAGAVDIDIGDLGAVERERQRFEIASEIDAVDKLCGHRGASTPVKSRSRATKTLMLVPCRTLSGGGICVAGIVAFPPGKETGSATTHESPAENGRAHG